MNEENCYELDMPFYHLSFPYLTEDMVEEINKQLLKEVPDLIWYNEIFRQDNIDYTFTSKYISLSIKTTAYIKVHVSKKYYNLNMNDYDVIADDIIRYICAKQYISLLKHLD